MNGVTLAIENVGLSELARRCGVSYQAVRKWEQNGIPAERAITVAEIAGIPLSILRPDLWPEKTNAA